LLGRSCADPAKVAGFIDIELRAVSMAGVRRNGLAKLTVLLQVAVSLLPFMSLVDMPSVSISVAIQVAVTE
jgi:hypothetical protein